MADPLDLDAIHARYFGGDDHRYYTGKTPLRDIRAMLEEIGLLCSALDEARAKAVDGGEWVTDYGHDPGRPTVHGIEWHPGLHCIRDTYQRRVWYGPVEPVTDDGAAP